MSIITPSSATEVVQKILQDVKDALPKTNPWLKSSLIKSNPTGLGKRVYDYYYVLRQAVKQCFPFDATDEYLQFWATLKNMLPLTSDESVGPMAWTGTIGDTVDAGSIWKVGTLEYSVDLTVTVESNEREIVSLTADGLTGVCVTSGDCNLADGMEVVISGIDQTIWNDTWENIVVTAENRFQFTIPSGMPTPTTGTNKLVTFIAALGNVTSLEKGAEYNQINGTEFTVETSLPGIDDNARCQFVGLTGGRDDEAPEEYQTRIVERWQKPRTPSNPNKLEAIVKAIPGNTRVWVHRVTPEVGAVTVFFVRDDEDSIIPEASIVLETKDAIFDSFGAQTEYEDVHVNDTLKAVPINVSISSVVPATTSMRAAIEATVRTYFRGSIREGQDFLKDRLKSDIDQTYDSKRGERLVSFNMDSPSVDSQIAFGQIAVEGTTTVS